MPSAASQRVAPSRLTRSHEIAASCFTGATVIGLTNPLDCLKQRWQVEPPGGQPSLLAFTRTIIRNEGLIAGLWAPGIIVNMCACTISVGTRLGFYPMLRDAMPSLSSSSSSPQKSGIGMFISGLLGGALGYVCSSPFFLAARVTQAEAGILCVDTGLYTSGARSGLAPTVPGGGGLAMLAHILRTQGLLGLWRGADVLVARGAIMSATQLTTYDKSKGMLRGLGLTDGPVVHCLASLAASITLTTAICPLDVTYTAFLAGPSLGRPYASPLACVRALVADGGAAALFRGWVPLWLRFLPSSVLTFVIYEQSRRILGGRYLD